MLPDISTSPDRTQDVSCKCRQQHVRERISAEQGRPHKAAYLEGAPSLRHALGKLSLERHSLKPVHEEEDPDVQQVEMLLQAYFIQMDNTFNRLETMNEYISDTEVPLLLMHDVGDIYIAELSARVW